MLLAACDLSGAVEPTGPPAEPSAATRPTQQASPSAQVAATAAIARRALTPLGLDLELTNRPYAPSEPPQLLRVPRAVYRITFPNPNEGWVVIYEFVDPAAAAAAGASFRAHLETGFAQTNFPFGAQFALTQVAGTLLFTWWAEEASADPDLAEQAVNAIGAIGQPITVTR